jgi:hypothetical protein
MKRPPVASLLLLIGGVLLGVGIPLPWSTVATADGSASASLRGIDYASYDVATTAILGLLLIACAFAVASGWRWAHLIALISALLACFWAALVLAAAANPAAATSPLVNVTIGSGAYVLAAGALLALIGSVMSFRGRNVAAVASAAPSGVS